ncbi:MAG: ABC transporter permease [Planctomycetes bacterium]|nr:ABC transporter permease [Planctomycetota bacterium]
MTLIRSRITASRALVLLGALAALVALFSALSAVEFSTGATHWPYFLTLDNAVEVGGSCAINLILGVGVTLVIIAGGIDLSVGRLIALTLVVMVVAANATGSLAAGLAAGLGAGLAAGLLNGILSVRFRIPSFIVTLGTMMIARGAAMLVAGGKSIGCAFHAPLAVQRFLPIGAALAVAAVGQLLLTKTIFGRHVFAVGGSPEAARLCGIRVGRVQTLTFLASGFCAGLAGFVYWCRNGLGDPLAGDGYELYAIAAVIVGGTSLSGGRGSVLGTLLGALIMGVLQNGLNIMLVQPHWQYIIIGSVLTVTVLADRLKRTE